MDQGENPIKEIKQLKFDSLSKWLSGKFKRFKDIRAKNSKIKLSDSLLSGFAMYSLKDPTLLFFNNKRSARRANLKEVYQIDKAPSDSGMRTILDEVNLLNFRGVFRGLVDRLRKAGVWEVYQYYRGHMICSVDGVHHYSSEQISCKHCLVYEKTNGQMEYRHYLLSGAIVHPDKKEVMPVIHEPILKQDGQDKNDCERNASKRLLPELRKQFKSEKIIVVEDALGANGPHIRSLQKEDFRFVIGVKPDGNKYLFELMERLEKLGKAHHYEVQKDGLLHQFTYANNLPLNSDNREIRVSFLKYSQIDPQGKKTNRSFSWITDFELSKTNVYEIMRVGRSRWKIENETFNTLKNQGYHFEHSFGHGANNLCTVLVLLMMLAFWVDQIQQGWNDFFRAARIKMQTKGALWEEIRSKFNEFEVSSMEMIYLLIIGKLKVKYEFYHDSG
jgi:hypothetical protein